MLPFIVMGDPGKSTHNFVFVTFWEIEDVSRHQICFMLSLFNDQYGNWWKVNWKMCKLTIFDSRYEGFHFSLMVSLLLLIPLLQTCKTIIKKKINDYRLSNFNVAIITASWYFFGFQWIENDSGWSNDAEPIAISMHWHLELGFTICIWWFYVQNRSKVTYLAVTSSEPTSATWTPFPSPILIVLYYRSTYMELCWVSVYNLTLMVFADQLENLLILSCCKEQLYAV